MDGIFRVALTFDFDLEDAFISQSLGEWEVVEGVPIIQDQMAAFPDAKMTFFVRADNRVADDQGAADFYFKKFADIWKGLHRQGHSVCWHPHPYRKETSGAWVQETQDDRIEAILRDTAKLLPEYAFDSIRMGWGFMTNRIAGLIDEMAIPVDSSAIPRPVYSWETSAKNWIGAPATPFFPSVKDYRVPGTPERKYLELPITTAVIKAPYDKETVVRYLNPAYCPDLLYPAIKSCCENREEAVLIAHPYEFKTGTKNAMFPNGASALRENIQSILNEAQKNNKAVRFVTIAELAEHHRSKGSAVSL